MLTSVIEIYTTGNPADCPNTNYWHSALNERGIIYYFGGGGHIHFFLPARAQITQEIGAQVGGTKRVFLVTGPATFRDDDTWLVQVVFDDGVQEPYSFYVGEDQGMPGPPEALAGGRKWTVHLWLRHEEVFRSKADFLEAPTPWMLPSN